MEIDKITKQNKMIDSKLNLKYKILLSYCLKRKKNTESINSKVSKTNNGKTMLLSKFKVCK